MLPVLIGALVGFACGAILGIVDCKKTYGIPHKANPIEGCWYSQAEVAEWKAWYEHTDDMREAYDGYSPY